MILSKQKCCLLLTGVSTEIQKRTSILQTKRAFLATRSMTRINVGRAELCEAFTFLMESIYKNIYVQFEGMVYQQIVRIPVDMNCAPLIVDLFLFCYVMDFMSNLHQSNRYDLIDLFNDTSRYLHDMFPIDNPEFKKHIPDIYPTELQLNKANTSKKLLSLI